jgi:hypothetical protein
MFSEDPEVFRRQLSMLALVGFGFLFCSGLIIVLQGWILRKAARAAAQIDIPVSSSRATAGAVMFVTFICMLPIGYFLQVSEVAVENQVAVQLLLLPMCFLLQAWLISEFHEVTLGQGAKITLFMNIISLMIAGFIGGLGFLFVGAAQQAANGY